MAIRARVPLVLLTLAVAGGCQKIVEEMPQQPTVVVPAVVPIPVVVVPVPVPTAAPGPPPAPAPGAPPAAPAPPPQTPQQPAPPPTGSGCGVPPSSVGGQCPRESPSFLGDVEAALDQLVRQEPSLFELGRTQGCETCYLVRNVDRYVSRVVDIMVQRGFCAKWDGEELNVKRGNGFSDHYDIITSGGYIRRQGGSYRATCRPAAF